MALSPGALFSPARDIGSGCIQSRKCHISVPGQNFKKIRYDRGHIIIAQAKRVALDTWCWRSDRHAYVPHLP
ncbi:hypothetical protein GGI17_006828, partial [Coemansia sp. S146]